MQTQQITNAVQHLAPMPMGVSQKLVARVAKHVERMLETSQIGSRGRLPSERTVALDLGVSRNTVTAAYGELEQRGLIRRIRGKGAFKCNPLSSGESFSWSGKVSSKAHLLDEPVLEMLARSGSLGLPYPFSAGTPSLECFPTDAYHACVNRVIANNFPGALAVAPTEGQKPLRNTIGQWMDVAPNRVMITSGAQEAVDLLARCLIEPGDYAIVDSPTYPGAVQSLRAAGARLVGWETDWSLSKLEQLLLRFNPKLIFTGPTFQNPTGKVMPLATRLGLLDLAARYHTPIIEDDVYGMTFLDGQQVPESLVKLDKRSTVVYISTFSKVLAPGLRVGWVIAPLYMVKQLSLMKMRATLFTDGLNQLALSDFVDTGGFDKHLQKLRQHHASLRNTAVATAQSAVEEGLLSFTPPSGGIFLWCRLDPRTDLDLLQEATDQKGLTFAPGHAFFPEQNAHKFLRLCFTAMSVSHVKKGIEILVQALRDIQPTLYGVAVEATASTSSPAPF